MTHAAPAEKQSLELVGILDNLVKSCGLKTVVLVTRNGTVIDVRGDSSYFDVTALAALLGAMFTATREVARMVGEEHFSILLQQGEKRHIHISLVPDTFMLAAIFEDVGRIGMIRLHTRKVADRVGEICAALVTSQAGSPASAPEGEARGQPAEFREYALDLIDRIFAED